MVAAAFEVPVVGRSLLLPVRWADGAVHVEDDFFHGLPATDPINPMPRQIPQLAEILRTREHVRLESAELTAGSGSLFGRSAAHDPSHGGIHGKPLGIVGVLVTGQTAVDRLPQHRRQGVLRVKTGPGIVQFQLVNLSRQAERLVECTIRQETGIAGDLCPVEFEANLTVEINPQGVLFAFTHHVLRP